MATVLLVVHLMIASALVAVDINTAGDFTTAAGLKTDLAAMAELPRQLMEAALWLGDLGDEVRDNLANVPLLLTWGIDDVAFPRHVMERFREDFSLVTTRRLDAKHYIQEDAPAEIAEAIEDFLA